MLKLYVSRRKPLKITARQVDHLQKATDHAVNRQPRPTDRESFYLTLESLDSETPPRFVNASTCVVNLTRYAFFSEKPLFTQSEKRNTFATLRRVMPILRNSYRDLDLGFTVEHDRRDAQISLSGLQFIADEVTESDDPDLYEQLQTLMQSETIKSIEESIQYTIGCYRDWGTDEEVDDSLIPTSHYWWFDCESEIDD